MYKSILFKSLGVLAILITVVMLFVYYVTYSEGTRSGELIKFSRKGVLFKTWEGEISQGISGAQIFSFSILDRDQEVIDAMKAAEGQYVRVAYEERFTTFPWWGETKYFITNVEITDSPHRSKYGGGSP